MLYSQKVGIELYENLGKLFYAVAMVDGHVHIKELSALKKIVRESWLYVDNIEDRYHTDASYRIETVFDWLLEYEKESEECFEDFEDFYKDNPKIFSREIKELILHTAHAIADSFSKKNKAELIILAKIDMLLKKSA